MSPRILGDGGRICGVASKENLTADGNCERIYVGKKRVQRKGGGWLWVLEDHDGALCSVGEGSEICAFSFGLLEG